MEFEDYVIAEIKSKPWGPMLMEKLSDQAAEIERLEAQLGVMRAALEGLLEWANEYCRTDKAPTYDALHPARQALATDAGKAAADVLTAVEAVRKLPFQHTGSIGALFDAYDAYRKEGRNDPH